MMKAIALIIGGASLLAWFLTRTRNHNTDIDHMFIDRIARMVHDWLRVSGLSVDDIERSVRSALDGDTASSVPGVARIEIEVEKISANQVDVTVLLLIADTAPPRLVRIKDQFNWYDLPSQYRNDFMHSNNRTLQYLIYPREELRS